MSKPISKAEIDRAIELAKQGMSYSEIGRAIHRTPSSISFQLKRRGVFVQPKMKMSNIEIENLQNRLNNGETIKAIATEMGIKPQSLNSYIRRLKSKGYEFNFRMPDKIVEYICDNIGKMPIKEICRQTGKTIYRVKQVMKEHSLEHRKAKIEEIVKRYPHEDTLSLANEFGVSPAYVRSVSNYRGIKKTKNARSLYGRSRKRSQRVYNLIHGIV